MAAPVDTAIPPNLDLGGGYVISFTALDPATGAVNTDVVISNASLLVDLLSGQSGDLAVPSAEPLWIPIPLGDQ